MIGSYGSILFEVSERSARTFADLALSSSQNYAEHKILNGNTLLEFTGKNARTCNLKIELSRMLGLDPLEELENLRKIFEEHFPQVFTLGKKIIGEFVIESMTENYNFIGSQGEIISVSVNLNLKEYL